MVEEYILNDDILYVKLIDSPDFKSFISTIKNIEHQLKTNKCKKALINTIGCKGDWNVSILNKYQIGELLVDKFHNSNLFKIAFVLEEKNYDGFAEMVANNRGAWVKMFFNELDGINWLKE